MRHMAACLRRKGSPWLRATVPWTLEGPGFRWNPRSSKPVGCAQRARWVRLPCSSAKKRHPRPRSARPLRQPQTILRTVRVRPQPCTPVYSLMIARSPRCSRGISSPSWPRLITSTRCDKAAMNSRFFSTSTMVSCMRSRSAARVSPISSMIDGWMPSVGSSSSSRLGWPPRARAWGQQLLLTARQRPARAVEQRLEARKVGQQAVDAVAALRAGLDQAHAQVVGDAQRREDLAPLRHIGHAQPGPCIERGAGDVGAVACCTKCLPGA
jgi:hypothetical protein